MIDPNSDEARLAELPPRMAAGIEKRSRLAQIALANLTPPSAGCPDPSSVKFIRSPGGQRGPNLIIKVDGSEIGRFYLDTGILDVPWSARSTIEELLRVQKYAPVKSLTSTPPLDGLGLRYEPWTDLIWLSAMDDMFTVDRRKARKPQRRDVGLLQASSGIGACIAPEFEDQLRQHAAALGIVAHTFLPPAGLPGPLPGLLLARLSWEADYLAPWVPEPVDWTQFPHLAEANRISAERSAAIREAGRYPERRVPAELAEALPASVTHALNELWRTLRDSGEREPGSRFCPNDGSVRVTSVITTDNVPLLLRATSPLPLPASTGPLVADVIERMPSHAPLVTALELRLREPRWWAELPVHTFDRDADGDPFRYVDHIPRSLREQSPHTSLLSLLDTRAPGSKQLPSVDWPFEFDVSEQLRAWLVIGALAHAHLVTAIDPAERRSCGMCGAEYDVGSLRLVEVAYAGTDDICRPCGLSVRNGWRTPWTEPRERSMPDALRALADEVGIVPSLGLLRSGLADRPPNRLAACALRSILPSVSNGHSQGRWLEWLTEAGLVESGWRSSRGILSVANDGHSCRSLFERQVDDFFSANGIEHQCEPVWPFHPEYNRTGLRRADWLLPGGVYVEAAGMMSKAEYRSKMQEKTQLAAALSVELITLIPDDIGKLASIFSRWVNDRDRRGTRPRNG